MFAEVLRQRSPIELSPEQIRELEKHFLLLQRWNRTLNLTSIRDPVAMVERHYCESLFLAAHLPEGILRIADVGSGAGFPGIPIAVVRPESYVSLIESHRRKAVFLREATRELTNADVRAHRLEDVSGTFDWAVCRGVRFSEISESINRIAERVAVLGGNQVPGGRFTWNDPIKLPLGDNRYLWITLPRST